MHITLGATTYELRKPEGLRDRLALWLGGWRWLWLDGDYYSKGPWR
jgi:hypothetical protein